MTEKRFTVEKMEMVSDHLSTRFFIHDNETNECYDVRHIVSEKFEVQYDSWAQRICEKLNDLHEENMKLKQDDARYIAMLNANYKSNKEIYGEYNRFTKKVAETLSEYWKKNSVQKGYLTTPEVLELILKDLGLSLIL